MHFTLKLKLNRHTFLQNTRDLAQTDHSQLPAVQDHKLHSSSFSRRVPHHEACEAVYLQVPVASG